MPVLNKMKAPSNDNQVFNPVKCPFGVCFTCKETIHIKNEQLMPCPSIFALELQGTNNSLTNTYSASQCLLHNILKG